MMHADPDAMDGPADVTSDAGHDVASDMGMPDTGVCEPACRPGFVCVRGTCTSACNPPCDPGLVCTADLQCVAPDSGVPVDAADGGPGDVQTDAATDAGFDAGVDVAADAGTETGADSGSDAGIDAGIDTGIDAGVDTGADVRPDLGCVPDLVTHPDAMRDPTAAHCSDGIRDTGESDVDCGGECNPCTSGRMCNQASDCVSFCSSCGICF